MTMQDLAELARQNFLARYEPSTNGVAHTKSERQKQRVNFCVVCERELQNGTRYRFRVEQQVKGRKWAHTGLEVYYMCSGCKLTQTALLLGGL